MSESEIQFSSVSSYKYTFFFFLSLSPWVTRERERERKDPLSNPSTRMGHNDDGCLKVTALTLFAVFLTGNFQVCYVGVTILLLLHQLEQQQE